MLQGGRPFRTQSPVTWATHGHMPQAELDPERQDGMVRTLGKAGWWGLVWDRDGVSPLRVSSVLRSQVG